MLLEDKIYQDYVTALKAKDKHKIDFLSFIRAELKNQAIEVKKKKLSDHEVWDVLKKQKKHLQDSKENIVLSGRADLITALEKELAVLDAYLPLPLQESELVGVIEEIISHTGASSMKDMGKVMKEVREKVGARADAKKVSEIVKSKLSP